MARLSNEYLALGSLVGMPGPAYLDRPSNTTQPPVNGNEACAIP